ncbi:MAG TPA: response regulator [Elusimicrobiota bacterium]|nr:response regulator [Elusimicrobiota bacterium]
MARILVVDDEESIRDLIKEVLSSNDHEITLAADGAQAFDVLRKKPIDLAIVDRNMPGMTGIEVVQLIRQNPKTAALKVLVCTGASVTKEIDEAFAAGADDYVLKPLNFTQLLGKVAKALGTAK